ncbi:hypothetical protein OKW28_002041 [Paraburkholderia sp. 40]
MFEGGNHGVSNFAAEHLGPAPTGSLSTCSREDLSTGGFKSEAQQRV